MNLIYEKNIKAINTYQNNLAVIIESADKPDWIEWIRSENGSANFLILMNQRTLPAYDMKNPINQYREIIQGNRLYKQYVSIVNGFGLGYLILPLLKKKEKLHRVIVIEPCLGFVKKALEFADYTKWIQDGTLTIIHNEDTMLQFIAAIDSINVIEDYNIYHEGYTFFNPKIYAELSNKIYNQLNAMRCNTGTVMSVGDQFAKNDIANLPYLIRCRGIAEIKGLFSRCPAVVVNTGPSLQKNIHHLIENQDKVVIVAIAQALRPLLAYGIRPDFICTVDYGDVNYEHFAGLMDCGVPLVVANRSYDRIMKEWEGTKFVVSTPQPGFENTTVGILDQKGNCEQGGSVSHQAFSFASYLGCSPITIIGQDLSYEGDLSHTPLADASGKIDINESGLLKWNVDDPSSKLKNDSAYEMGNAITIPAYWGGIVYTNVGLMSFITAFENLVKICDKMIFNSTEGGAKIKGFKQITLKAYLEKFAKKKIDKKRIKKYSGYAENSEQLIDECIPRLKTDIKLFADIIKNASLGYKYTVEARKNKGDKDKCKESLSKNFNYSNIAHKFAKQNSLMGVSIFNESRIIQSRQYHIKNKPSAKNLLKNSDDLDIRLDRSAVILKAAIKAAHKLRKLYKEVLIKFEKYKDGDNSELSGKCNDVYSLDKVDEYFAKGNWAWPLLTAQKIIGDAGFENGQTDKAKEVIKKAVHMREDAIEKAKQNQGDNELLVYLRDIEKAQEVGRKGNYSQALVILRQAKKIKPDRKEAAWGYATTLVHLNRFKEADEEYQNLIKKYPDDLQIQFEYGRVLLQIDVDRGLQTIIKVMEKTEEYDYFFARIGDLYFSGKKYDKAVLAYEKYLEKFPYDYRVMQKQVECCKQLKQQGKVEKIEKQIQRIKA